MNDNMPNETISSIWKICALYDEALLKEVRNEDGQRLFWRTVEAMFFNEQLAVMRGEQDRDYMDTDRSIRDALNEIAPRNDAIGLIAHKVIQLAIMAATIFASNGVQKKNGDDVVRFVFENRTENPTNCQQTICRILYLLNKKSIDQSISESKTSSLTDRLMRLLKS